MTVKAIRLENFMAFEDTGWIELRPITLLFGKNSRGKSTIIRALRLLKQSLDQCLNEAPLAFAVEDGVDIGRYKTAVHNHTLEEIITFSFRCDFVNPVTDEISILIDPVWKRINQRRTKDDYPEISLEDTQSELDLSLSFGWDYHKQMVVPVAVRIDCAWEILQDQELRTIIAFERQQIDLIDSNDQTDPKEQTHQLASKIGQHKVDKNDQTDTDPQTQWTWAEDWLLWSELLSEHEEETVSPWATFTIEFISGFLPHLIGRVADAFYEPQIPLNDFDLVKSLLVEFRGIIERFLHGIEYLGPIRPQPTRRYSLNQFEQRHWRQRGLNAFIEFLSNQINEEEKATEIGDWLDYLDLGETVSVNAPFAGQMGLAAEVEIQETAGRRRDNVVDIGYGTSQVLPVIVHSVLATPGHLVIIEQPELHLHPSGQAELTDMFIRQTYKLKQDDDKRLRAEASGVRFLLETHSEYLLLRARRRIAETTARKKVVVESSPYLRIEDTGLYFVERYRGEGKSTVERIDVNSFGEFDRTPRGFDGFFSDDLKEMAELSKVRRYALSELDEIE